MRALNIRNYIFMIGVCLLLLPKMAGALPIAQLIGLRIQSSSVHSRLTLTLNQSTTYRIFTLKNPNRLVLELKQIRAAIRFTTIKLNNANIISVRQGRHGQDNHIVLDMRVPFRYTARWISANQENGVKLELNVYSAFSGPSVSQTVSPRVVKTTQLISANPPSIKNKRPRRFIVVIDAGHGGKDTGAIGSRGVREKAVALAVAKDLASRINAEPHMRAILTREGDYFLPLRTRLMLARREKANLFIAIHADSERNDTASGASVYALSTRGASSEAARWLARRENYSELDAIDFDRLQNQSLLVRSVLIDMAQTSTITNKSEKHTS